MEIMKITGTPTKEFTAKLQSEDVRFIHIFPTKISLQNSLQIYNEYFRDVKIQNHMLYIFFSRLETT